MPHHTANSWASYWARDPLADRLLAVVKSKTAEICDHNARGGGEASGDEDDEETEEEISSCGGRR